MPFLQRKLTDEHYDVFNGDADGICALHQIRLNRPAPGGHLITGVKREIGLLNRIRDVRNSTILVLDISMDTNRVALNELLDAGNDILYVDHHFAGDIPTASNLKHYIDPAPNRCTSLIVDQLVEGKFSQWALCGAFGDNLHEQAALAALRLSLSREETDKLREIGELLNYNGYGSDIKDLYFPPDQLYRAVSEYRHPLDFYEQSQALKTLRAGFANDMDLALAQPLLASSGANRVFRLPDSPWSRRISGVFANLKARENPAGAHALITENSDGTLRISVRAPLTNQLHADTLCRMFPTGGGRAAAAGINALPEELLNGFLDAFNNTYR